ncbi:DUF3995 domain-containing protein [Mesorhizobium sp. B1-1-5]|nr:DUF3995 domain-containing protein [Mesorhizobium sp. B1-1-5]
MPFGLDNHNSSPTCNGTAAGHIYHKMIFIILWAAIFTLRALSWWRYFGLFKRVRTTRFARYDSLLYSPSCLLLGLGLFLLALADAA